MNNFNTRAIHSGRALFKKGSKEKLSDPTGAINIPLYYSSTFKYFQEGNYDYTRSGNPNFESLGNLIASLEGAEYATVFGSGVSAITAVFQTLSAGDTILFEENVYGCTYRLIEQVYRKFGVNTVYTDFSNPGNFAKIEELKPKIVWVESPTNPLLKIIDIESLAKYSKKTGSLLVVDNTFASPYLQRPLELGADVSLASTTKYLMGHSVCLGGVVCTNNASFNNMMIFQQKASGLQPSPFDAWVTQLGIATLGIRMEAHCQRALALGNFLEEKIAPKYTRYPFLKSHPQYELAAKQMRGGSGIITIDLNRSLEDTKKFIQGLKYFALAESLGAVESLVCHPASMTHASVPKEVRLKVGITDSVIRFSVGLEDVTDLIDDIKENFERINLSKSSVQRDCS
jgi:cystathionine beta-lyase/cystathionine gamma-synthase